MCVRKLCFFFSCVFYQTQRGMPHRHRRRRLRRRISSHRVPPERHLSVLVAGDSAVGKTCWLERLMFGFYSGPERYSPTIEDSYVHRLVTGETRWVLHLTEIGGAADLEQHTGPKLDGWGNVLEEAPAFDLAILMYAVDSRRSFDYVLDAIDMLQRRQPHCKIIVLGNKCDIGAARQVITGEADRAMQSLGIAEFAEVSAAMDYSVDVALASLDRIFERPAPAPEPAPAPDSLGLMRTLRRAISRRPPQ